MRRLVLACALALASCHAARPPIAYGGYVNERNDKLFHGALQNAVEHCSGDKGPLEFAVRQYDWKQKTWTHGTLKPEHCYYKAGGLLQAFEQAVLLSAPAAPSYDQPDPQGKLWAASLTADDQAVHDSLMGMFSRDIVRGSEKTASGETVRIYDGAAIEAIFDKVYARPTEVRSGMVLQQVYDVLYRDTLREIAGQLASLEAHPDLLGRAVAEFEQRAPSDPNFNFWDVSDHIAKDLAATSPATAAQPIPSFLGTVVRRTHDGTLPILRRLLVRVLHDYDPTFPSPLLPR